MFTSALYIITAIFYTVLALGVSFGFVKPNLKMIEVGVLILVAIKFIELGLRHENPQTK